MLALNKSRIRSKSHKTSSCFSIHSDLISVSRVLWTEEILADFLVEDSYRVFYLYAEVIEYTHQILLLRTFYCSWQNKINSIIIFHSVTGSYMSMTLMIESHMSPPRTGTYRASGVVQQYTDRPETLHYPFFLSLTIRRFNFIITTARAGKPPLYNNFITEYLGTVCISTTIV